MEFERFTRLTPYKKPLSKGSRICSVTNCGSLDDGKVRFHKFPKPGQKIVVRKANGAVYSCDSRKVWEDIVGVDQKITNKSQVCSLHFEPEAYKSQGMLARLKDTAIPTLNLPDESGAFLTFQQSPEALSAKDYIQNMKRNLRSALNCSHDTRGGGPNSQAERNEPDETQAPVASPQSPKDCNQNSPSTQTCDKSESLVDLMTAIVNQKVETDSSAIFNDQILDMLLMYSSYELEKLASSGDLGAISSLNNK